MARQRDYAKEYRGRVKREIARGYKSYPEARKSRVEIVKEIKELAKDSRLDLKIPSMRTSAGRHEFQLYEKARKSIARRNLQGERGAPKSQRLSEKISKNIRDMLKLKYGEEDWLSYYHPLMRSFY